jgi:hypothetical protein
LKEGADRLKEGADKLGKEGIERLSGKNKKAAMQEEMSPLVSRLCRSKGARLMDRSIRRNLMYLVQI